MKVDSTGAAVSEGTYGLCVGNAALIRRTFVDPTIDNEDTQEIIASGGYILDLGGGRTSAYPPDKFTASPYGPNEVRAQDGQVVEAGDIIHVTKGLGPDSSKEGPYTVAAVYPLGKLQGDTCVTLADSEGAGPDGKWAVSWGEILKVVNKAGAKAKPAKATIKKGDWICFKSDNGKLELSGEVTGFHIGMQPIVTLEQASEYPSISKGQRYVVKSLDHILEHRPASSIAPEQKAKTYNTPVGPVKVGDRVRVRKTTGIGATLQFELLGVVTKLDKSGGDEIVRVKIEEITGGTYSNKATGTVEGFYPSRITEILLTNHAADEENIMEEQEMAKRKKEFGRVDIVREGTQITLPGGMDLRTAIKELERQAAQEEMDVNIMELIPGFPLDAAHAFVQALAQKFGWVNALPTPGFFGPTPPTMIGIQVDPEGRTVQIPWGKIGIPGLSGDGSLQTGIQFVDNRPVFCIGGTVKQKDKGLVNEIAKLTKDYLLEHSIYKGKAIRVKFPDDPKKFSPLDHQPKFIATANIREEELIFSASVEKQVRVNIWTPIQSLAAVRAAKVPLKRGVLLYGRYGVGKTLLASVTAKMCVQAGITFIDLVNSKQLLEGVEFARMLGGMVALFAEDIDVCSEELLKKVDGLTSKTDEVLIVYTTNHIERISKAMLRQGRIDKVIHIKEPDAGAAERLVRLYARHMLAADEDIREVSVLLQGFIPAAIREVVEQSKLAAIERGDVHHISAEDLRVTAENTKEHMELLKEAPKDDRSELEKFGDAVGKRMSTAILEAWNGEETELAEANEDRIHDITRRKVA